MSNSLVNKQPPIEMRIDIYKVCKLDEILVNADKTRNIYCVKGPVHQTAWGSAPGNAYNNINTEAKKVADSIGVAERIETP